jgi:hypothetical protein
MIKAHATPSAMAIEARFSAGWLRQASRISNCLILREGTPPSAIWRIHRCRLARWRICLAIQSPRPLTERSGDGITKRHRRFASGKEASIFVCPCRPSRQVSDNEPVADRSHATLPARGATAPSVGGGGGLRPAGDIYSARLQGRLRVRGKGSTHLRRSLDDFTRPSCT